MTPISFKQYLVESTADKGILKAVFVVGIPGAGKSYTIKKLSGAIEPRIVNTDKAAEFLAKKLGQKVNSSTWDTVFKDSSHRITLNALNGYLNGMLPLFIDGTSNDASNILHRAGILESLGYDVGIVFIDTSVNTAIKRAKERAEDIARDVDEDFIRSVAALAEENKEYFKSKFQFFAEIKNDDGELTDRIMASAFNKVLGFFGSSVKNPVGTRILAKLADDKQKYLVPTILDNETLSNKVTGWYKS